jgi:3-phosphoshikimate 1-carboxyvinyltransferase
MLASVEPARALRGGLALPGDKSVSHRSLLLNAIASGEARISGLSGGADVTSTAGCLRAMGVEIEADRVIGVGLRGLQEPRGPLDCGNSGTTMRLMAGLMAGQPFSTTLIGDESLSKRPMGRVADPLRLMGAEAETDPLRIRGGRLRAIDYRTPVASAQIKSALLLAALFAEGTTTIVEPAPTRDHTERMLAAMGAPMESNVRAATVCLRGPAESLRPLDVTVPGDLSSAAFWLVAGGLHPDAEITLGGVGVNPSRSFLLDVLERAGIRVVRERDRRQGAEPVADLVVGTSRDARPFHLSGPEAALVIDELPVLAVAASLLPGTTRIEGAAELRVKESDRIAAMAAGLSAMGADVEERPDGWVITGPCQLEGARVASAGDHRVAMALAVAALMARGTTEIEGAECVEISYPGFWDDLEAVRC